MAVSRKNKGVVFSGSVASVTRRMPMPKPKKTKPRKTLCSFADGPWKGNSIYLADVSGTLPMNIGGSIGRYARPDGLEGACGALVWQEVA